MKPGNGKQVKMQRLAMSDCVAIAQAVQNNHATPRCLALQGVASANP
jgi:hypothetical protein